MIISTVVNNEYFLTWRYLPDLGLLTKSKVVECLYIFARRHSSRLSSTLEPMLRITSAMMILFFLSAVYIMRRLGENVEVF